MAFLYQKGLPIFSDHAGMQYNGLTVLQINNSVTCISDVWLLIFYLFHGLVLGK